MAARRPMVVEVAGLAGAGKSTLASALARLDPEIRARPRLPNRTYLAAVPALLRTFVSLHWPFHGMRTKEMKRILRVGALHRWVHDRPPGGTVLFDEGPVYMLARTLVFGGDGIRSAAFERWWRAAIADWAATLDVVVWLDAPDPVLAARIETRAQPHPLRGAQEQAVRSFFSTYRDAFNRVLGELCGPGGPQLWWIATDTRLPGNTARAVLARLHSLHTPTTPVLELARWV